MVEDYSWIKVKRFLDDESLSYEDRFNILLKHHDAETKFLIGYIKNLEKRVYPLTEKQYLESIY